MVQERHNPQVSGNAKNENRLSAILSRHAAALGYVLRVVLPVILRTGRRPVIFSRYIGMGDIVCTIPAALELKKRHPGATFIYNCHPDFIGVPQLAHVAGQVTTLKSIGIVGHWYRFLLGGFYHFAHGGDTPGQIAREPMVGEFFRQFDLPYSDTHPLLKASAAAHEKAGQLLADKKLAAGPLVLLHPGPSWKVKEWPQAHWTQLVAELRQRGFTNIAQLGVGRYLTTGKIDVETVPGAVSLIDQLSIEECLAVIGRAKLFIGIDSGLLHLAASARTPSVGLWGSTSPQFFYGAALANGFVITRVECRGCEHQNPRWHWFTNCPYDIKCMPSISVADVLPICLKVLEKAVKN